jgi:hypothetical protein
MSMLLLQVQIPRVIPAIPSLHATTFHAPPPFHPWNRVALMLLLRTVRARTRSASPPSGSARHCSATWTGGRASLRCTLRIQLHWFLLALAAQMPHVAVFAETRCSGAFRKRRSEIIGQGHATAASACVTRQRTYIRDANQLLTHKYTRTITLQPSDVLSMVLWRRLSPETHANQPSALVRSEHVAPRQQRALK